MLMEKKWYEILFSSSVVFVVVLGIYLSSLYSYILFHGLVELVSIAIAFAIFILAWNSRAYLSNNYLGLLGIGYAFIAFIDLVHTFSFQGMTVFTGYDDNLAPQLWLAARYLQAVTLVVAPLLPGLRMNNYLVFSGYTIAVAILLTIIYSGYFPDCLITGKGLTPFKVYSEYVISVVLVVALFLLYRIRHVFDRSIFLLIAFSIVCTIASELAFTAFISMYDFSNMFGHFAKLAAFYLIYRAILVTGMKKPFELIFRDLKQAEEALRQKTIELTAAKEQAEKSNRAKSVFLANMSHELRTPLNAVLGFAQVIKNDTNINPEQRGSLEIITRSGEHLLNLINNVLDISKIESGRVELEESSCDLNQLLQEVKSIMFAQAASKGLLFSLEQSPDLPHRIIADAGKLRQLLINLIGNAVKFTEQGGIVLRALVASEENMERPRLRFEVEDSGPGIKEEDRRRIFSPFEQVGEHFATDAGTGLGLSICRQYVELMDGEIDVIGGRKGGALFYFEVPILLDSSQTADEPVSQGRVIGTYEPLSGYRILIAEDQPENRLLLRKLLAPLGFELKEAVSGEEAITLWQSWKPQLIFMDIRMPVMNGLEATRRIREADIHRETRIIIITAHALEEERREILAAGCDDFIRKPYHDWEIHNALSRNLGIHFRYAVDESDSAGVAEPSLTDDELSLLPKDLAADLLNAVESLDNPRIFEVINRAGDLDRTLRERLRRMAGNLQYKDLLASLDSLVKGEKGESGS